MSPTEKKKPPLKKSLRLWVKNNGHVVRKEKLCSYVYPRTVEAAQDPFICSSGKNKMFFLIAINVFPDSMIVVPDTDSETDGEEEEFQSNPGVSKTTSTIKKAESPRNNNTKKKRTKPEVSTANVPQSLRPHNPEIATVEAIGNEGNSKKQTRTRRQRPISKKTGPTGKRMTNNENCKRECSTKLLEKAKMVKKESLSKLKENRQSGSGHINTAITSNSRTNSTASRPVITDKFYKIIQDCSDTGVVSFSLSNNLRKSRS